LITGEAARQSTNLRAVELPAVEVKPADRHYLIGRSDACVIVGDKTPRPRREKRGDDPEDLLKGRYYGANARRAPVGSNIEALFHANAALFLGRVLRRIVLILLRFVGGNRRLRNSALDSVSSNQLVPSKPQERLR
jgi:hypothetical protein